MSYDKLASFPASYDKSPELTGTGLAKLYSFSPGADRQFINEIDKETGAVITSYPLPGAGASVEAWAFAHWGGDFFAIETVGGKNVIHRYDMAEDKFEVFINNSPYKVVGAGVSSCAPVQKIN